MKTANALIFGLAILISAIWLGHSYVKRTQPQGTITVTGLGQKDFTSDLIVWSGSFSQESSDLKDAYSKIEKDKITVLNYLKTKGIKEDEIIFDAVSSNIVTKAKYSDDGKYIGEDRIGYSMSQVVTIKSSNVELVEKISREITELLNQGISFYSYQPAYYYTKLSDLKLQLIKEATVDAYTRAKNIVDNSKGKLGGLLDASTGVFQITGQYSEEDYSWGGVYNTTSKNKTASITVRLTYKVK